MPYEPPSFWRTLGFEADARQNMTGKRRDITYSSRHLVVPLWLVLLGFAIVPAVRFGSQLFRRSRDATFQCRYCSYDLTGNVSGVCPECGRESGDSKSEISNRKSEI
jgi:hypothetical protein